MESSGGLWLEAGAEFSLEFWILGGLNSVAEFLFPGAAEFFTASQNELLRFFEVLIDASALDLVARAAAGDQVGRILFPFVSARNHEIDGEDESIVEAGFSVQATVTAAEVVAFEDFPGFGLADRLIDDG